jgi:transposase
VDFSKERSLTYLRAVAQLQHDENVRLKERVAELEARLGQASVVAEDNAVLTELLERREHLLFGKSSERRKPPAKDKPAKERQPQTGHGPREQPGLERETITHELGEDARVCACCGHERVQLGELVEESELVGIGKRSFVIEVHVRRKYRCQCDERQTDDGPGPVVTAPGPLRLVPGGRYSPRFAVEVAIAKYADHLPLERQVHIMKREGLRIDSQTLWDQIDLLARHLQPTYEAICKAILQHPVIHADETRWPLLSNSKTQENKLFQAWGLVAPELVAYRILDSRSKEAGALMLGGYTGVVMADAYTVYQSLAADGGFIVANCWAHVRRNFVEAEKNFPLDAGTAIDLIRQLYAVEREAKDETRGALRAEKSRTIVDKLFEWARTRLPGVLPRSGIGEALGYMLNQERGLCRFLDDARIPLDNNACERALRGVVLGRKNHYGSRSRRGTEVAAIMYTFMACTKLAEVPLRDYLTAVTELAIREPGAVLMPGTFKDRMTIIPP